MNNTTPTAIVPAEGSAPMISSLIYAVLVLPSLLVFFLWREYEPIRSRGYVLVIVSMLANVIVYVVDGVAIYLAEQGRLDYCPAEYWMTSLYVPAATGPFILRAIRLLVLHHNGKILWFEVEQGDNRLQIQPRSAPTNYERFLTKKFFWITKDLGGVIFISLTSCLAILLAAAIYLTSDYLTNPGWCLTSYASLTIAIPGIVQGIVVIFLIVALWNVKDGFSIKGELLALLFLNVPLLVLYLLATNFGLSAVGFAYAVMWWSWVVAVLYPLLQAMREPSNRIKRSNSDSSSVAPLDEKLSSISSSGENIISFPTLNRKSINISVVRTIVIDPQHYQNIMTIAVQCFCVENVAFCREVLVDFDLACTSPETTLAKAQEIGELYIKMGSQREINIDYKTRQAILDKIDNNQVDSNLFKYAINEISLLVIQTLVPRMIQQFKSEF